MHPWLILSHVAAVLWVFAGPILGGRLPYFRDVSTYYYPNYVFLERAMAQGVWPLWHPGADAGTRFLIVDPMDLLLVGAGGAEWALRLGPALHMFIAMLGVSFLARTLGQSSWGAWMAGSVYGLSGFYVSTLNLFELSHGASWAPWVVAAFLGLLARPTARRAAILATLAALQTSTLAGEVLIQTALLGLALVARPPTARVLKTLALACVLGLLLAAPALLGVLSLVEGTQRASGFSSEGALGWSATPVVLLDLWLPRFFGDPHTFTDVGFWGQSFFPDRYPYLLSLYVGVGAMLVAFHAGRTRRLWTLSFLGVLLSLGPHGPLAPVVAVLMRSFRTPMKFMFLTSISLALLAGWGLHRATRGEGRRSWLSVVPGVVLLGLGLLLFSWPEVLALAFANVVPALGEPLALDVVAGAWPRDFAISGLCAALVAIILNRGARLAPLAGLIVVFDLLIALEGVNPWAEATFYKLEPAVKALLTRVAGSDHRWFSYGFANTQGLHPSNAVRGRNRDVWLYYFDRQSLLPRMHVLDGLEGAYDEDRVGWAPPLSTFTAEERNPTQYPRVHKRLRLAGVHYVLSLARIDDPRLRERETVALPELEEPLRLYELLDPLPRSFFVAKHRVVPLGATPQAIENPAFDPREWVLLNEEPPFAAPAPHAAARVAYERVDPHTVIIRASTPAGLLVVLDGFDDGWRAQSGGRAVPLLRANGRYQSLPTPGGERVFILRYRPRWLRSALAALGCGLLGSLIAFLGGGLGVRSWRTCLGMRGRVQIP